MTLALSFALLAAGAAAVEYPKPVDDHVNDFAEVLDAGEEGSIRTLAAAVRRERAVPIVVVTVKALADYGATDWSIERYAAGLYNDWGIGSASENRGVLFVVSVKDRKVRIASGHGFANDLDATARATLDREVLPRFKKGDYGGGILAGVEKLAAAIRGTASVDSTTPGEGGGWTRRGTPVGDAIRKPSRGSPIGWIVLAVLGVVALGALSSVFRGRAGGGFGGFSGAPRAGLGGWGGLMMGGLGGFLGSALYNSIRGRSGGGGFSSGGSGASLGGGSSWGGGGSSFGGGFSSGGGASGSW